ncbi:MAG: universal stress protein [Chloroflexota bacterium]
MYGNIVVGFDSSEFSKAALIESSNWVRRHGGKITLVHAVLFDEEEFVIMPEQREKRIDLGKTMCRMTHELIESEFGFNGNLESLVCEGEPCDVIVDVANGKSADLIALGTYGRRGLRRLFMGSVTSGVIVQSHCDVLVVKRTCSECTGRYESLLVPFDGSKLSREALSRACELSRSDGAEVTVVYVVPRYEEMVGFFRTAAIQKSLMREAEGVVSEARSVASGFGVPVNTVIQEGHAATRVVEIAGTLKSDLIVMGSHGWSGIDRAVMGSTAERVITHASCPVLIAR